MFRNSPFLANVVGDHVRYSASEAFEITSSSTPD